MKFKRLNIKHFAELATNNGIFGSAQASSKNEGMKTTDYDQIASLPAFKEGWNAATISSKALAPLEEMQGLESYLSYLINYLYQQGIATWDVNYTYYVGNIVSVVDSETNNVKLYSSLTNNNKGNDPSTDTGNWATVTSSKGLGGGEIGDVGFAPLGIDETLNLRRYLNGQVISQSQFVSFTNKVKSAIALYPNLAATETNWQAEKTNSKLGQCGKFVVDDTAGTIRLPCVVNAQGLTDLALIGGIKSESLPTAVALVGYNGVSGEFRQKVANYTYTSDSHQIDTSAPMSSETTSGSQVDYLNDKPVQQEAVQYPYYIQVATGVEETLPAIREYQINTPFFFGQSMYSDVAPDNASWLVSNGQWNAKSVYPDYYDWLVEQMNAGVSGFVASTAAYTDYDFVINTANQTFRLPLKNGQEGIFADGVKGNGMTLGVTNGTDNFGLITGAYINNLRYFMGHSTDAYGKPVGSGTGATMLTADTWSGVTTDPSKSGIVVDKTVPSGWNLYYYVGDTVQDASLINAGAVLGQLANGINRTVKSDRETVVGWGFPDWDTEVQLSGTEYTATYKCWLVSLTNISGTAEALLYINGKLVTKEYGDYAQLQIPLDVGDVVTSNTPFTGTSIYAMKGLVND